MASKKSSPSARIKKQVASEKKKNRKKQVELKKWTLADEAQKELQKEKAIGVSLDKALSAKKSKK